MEKGERDGLVPHCLLYLVARTLNEGAKVSPWNVILIKFISIKFPTC